MTLLLGLAIGAGGSFIYLERQSGVAESVGCADRCGEGTSCEAGLCLVARVEAKQARQKTKKRRRRRGKARARKPARTGALPEAEYDDDLPPFVAVNDRHIPRFDRQRVQRIQMSDGAERISDHEIRQEMRRLEPAFNRCLATAARYSDADLRGGSFDFVFGVRSSGKVNGVNISAPKHLRVYGTIACMRKVVFDHKFRSFDGPTMGVDYGFEVD